MSNDGGGPFEAVTYGSCVGRESSSDFWLRSWALSKKARSLCAIPKPDEERSLWVLC